MSDSKLIVILGSGPGIGASTGALFASMGFDVALLSRNVERLGQDVIRVQTANPRVRVKAYPVDVGDHNALALALAQVRADLGPPEVVYFNAARVAPSKIGGTSPDLVLEDFKSMNIGLFVAASWALPHLTAAAERPGTHPSFLFTNSGLWDRPLADFASLSMQKAAQYNLMLSLKQMVETKGVHVAGVNIGGLVRDEDPVINANNIARALFDLSQEDKPDWQWEVKVGDWDEFLKQMAGQKAA
ncbi:uncharacterized protein Z519_06435 [Cladophialophora bantiana CBS 173.52]|uniref:Short-chain dehydrogenase/reductase SDR n=1 Tax=Cladophialophora bantiana (strain ATCC 10958 / CBS 173.52 / CDC B-1940 / NIH 8579) TaxID=1442370 RepID=A0A0D2HH57_CLAB1|nr:uncharacterized protein Z519_06435 [Cladophialophora bantiana CBS 173.52]KIW92588.1 hypothetical protein Z519_06435 [Cladophialophora bantiana CBS 173.52]